MRPWQVGVLTFIVVGLALISFTPAAGLIAIACGIFTGWGWSRWAIEDAPES